MAKKRNRKKSANKTLLPMYGATPGIESWLKRTFGISYSHSSLLKADDWTFVIKMHAFAEAALNHLLITKFANPALQDIIPRVEINARLGKLVLIRAYGLLSDEDCAFIDALSALRNRAVHDVRHLDLTLSKYIASLKPTQLKNWRTGMTCWMKEFGGVVEEDRDNSVKYPKQAIFSCVTWIIANALLREHARDSDQFHAMTQHFGEIWIVEPDERVKSTSNRRKGARRSKVRPS